LKSVSLTLRLFLFGTFAVALAGWFGLYRVLDEMKPAVRQSTEETLVDTANLLAEILAADMRAGTLDQGDVQQVLTAYGQRRPDATIWRIRKDAVTHRIYVTDARGIVILDSAGEALGQDYSQWNDVFLTLRGRYGARTTETMPGDEGSSVMHVAAPIFDGDRIIGSVTVAKPNASVQPFIERAERRLILLTASLVIGGVVVGGLLSAWLSRAIRRLTRFANAVTAGERPAVPELPGDELTQLASALDTMRTRLEGKDYVERYVQTLTHELKSPLAAIHGAAELLRRDMAPEQRERFLANIEAETARLQSLSERLLRLAHVEQRRGLEDVTRVELGPLAEELLAECGPRLELAGIRAHSGIAADAVVRGERFLLRQALLNLIDNAIEFTPRGGRIDIGADPDPGHGAVTVWVRNDGEPVPDYALPRLTERFYSLARPGSGRKSTGLGLNLVQEVAQLHGGEFNIANEPGGVRASLAIPAD
jgi:two-component system sensor histidine kinase CreC